MAISFLWNVLNYTSQRDCLPCQLDWNLDYLFVSDLILIKYSSLNSYSSFIGKSENVKDFHCVLWGKTLDEQSLQLTLLSCLINYKSCVLSFTTGWVKNIKSQYLSEYPSIIFKRIVRAIAKFTTLHLSYFSTLITYLHLPKYATLYPLQEL